MAEPSLSHRIRTLEERLGGCMIRDRARVARQLRNLKGGGRKQRDDAPDQIARLEKQVASSIARAERRRAALMVPTYPSELPITEHRQEILDAIASNQVIVLTGETGSGKTTQLPKMCLELGRGVLGQIGHTQPRRVAARTVSARIAEELGVTQGREVGYQVRFTDKSDERTLVKVMTDGILLAETQRDRFLDTYDTLIIDEAHERSLNIDFLLGYLKNLLPRRRDLKVIITSATIDVERFSRHFDGAPVIEVSGRTYPVEVLYRPLAGDPESGQREQPLEQAVLEALEELDRVERAKGGRAAGDVLIFLPGEREIRELAHFLRRSRLKGREILPLYARLGLAEQNRVFAPHKTHRIVLATNVAETSLTVPGIRYVIDPGYARISRYSYRSKVQRLHIEPVSKASADQRKGRCGRLSDGICIRLYSEEEFERRSEFTDPEILRTNLAAVILQMRILRLGEIERFPFVEMPERRGINDGYHLLTELGAVDRDRAITSIGRQLARLPVDLRLGRMLLAAHDERCLAELLIIASGLAVQDPRERPPDHQQAADEAHEKYWDENSDFLAYVNLWNAYEAQRQSLSQNQLRKWCDANYLSFLRMREWRDVHRQLHLLCTELRLRENREAADYASVHRAILFGLLGNLGERAAEREYQGARNRRFFIFPASSQFRRTPRWVMAGALIDTTRLYAHDVARIEREWIEPIAEHLVKREWSDPYWDRPSGRVMAFETVTLYGIQIVANRRVNFGPIDPAAARTLFIQAALVERQLDTDADFYLINNEVIDDIANLEHKTRSRDILVEPREIHRFYDEVLPAEVCDAASFESWWVDKRGGRDRSMYMSRAQLMRREAAIFDANFPDRLETETLSLPLEYRFDPQFEEDGVTVNVPVAALRQLPANRIEWLIPGLLREKCLALVRSLPKALRKNFVPAPEYVDRALEEMEYDGRSLEEALGERLRRLAGVTIPADAWRTEQLPNYLRMNIRVVDDDGTALGMGRSLADLAEEFGGAAATDLSRGAEHALERSGVMSWDFGELPESVERTSAGVAILAYPALVDEEKSIAIRLVGSREEARRLSEAGVVRLLHLRLSRQVSYLRKNVPGFRELSLYYATIGSAEELLDDIVEGAFRNTFIDGQSIPSSREEFERLCERRQHLVDNVNQLGRILAEALKSHNALRARLAEFRGDGFRALREDVEAQLAGLVHPGFVSTTPLRWLREYPRFLRAVEHRLEKVRGALARDAEATAEIQRYAARYLERGAAGIEENAAEFVLYRWMVEEYRVSLFAQPLGTSVPVSAKRLERQWAKV